MSITTLASWAFPIVKALDAYGIDGHDLMRRAGLDPAVMRGANARYSYEGITRLWNMAAAASRDSAFGLAVAGFWHPTTLHALGFAWMASATLYDALERLARYARIVNNAVDLKLADDGAETVLYGRLIADDVPNPTDSSVNAAAAVIVRM